MRQRSESTRNGRCATWMLLALTTLTLAGCWNQSAAPTADSATAGTTGHVDLVIDYGDGERNTYIRPWRRGTVLDLLKRAREQGLRFEVRGEGQTAFVEAIGHARNAGVGEKDRNWVFFVNDQKGRESAGMVEIKPGDRVLWKYTAER